MRNLKSMQLLLVAGAFAAAGCSQAQEQTKAPPEKKAPATDYGAAKKSAPPKAPSADASAPTGEPIDKEKEKRANTPPGTDRSGGGPASGAIVDPAGVTQK